jgi:recombination protein RecT
VTQNDERGETVRGAVARRQGQQEQGPVNQFSDIEGRIENAFGWFKKVVPSHVDPEQFVALGIGCLRKDRKLAAAAQGNPGSFMQALSECARLGLIPGDTFWLTHFANKNNPPGVRDIVGMVGYNGEIELMFRSGGVASVHCQVVRDNDEFNYQPGMILPEHRIADDGLAEIEERGALRAVYAYARLINGGISDVALLNKGAVMRARDKAKTKEFWGPEWPQEGPNTEPMWKKTGVHRLWNYVPHSSEYIAERMRAEAAAQAQPLPPGPPPAPLPSSAPPALGPGGGQGGAQEEGEDGAVQGEVA